MRFLIYFLLIILGCFFAAQSADAEELPIKERLKIGFVLPITGEWASLGVGIKNGAILAVEESPIDSRAELFFEDNRGELAVSASAAQRLIQQEKVDAIISIISGVAKVIQPLASREGVLSIGICSDLSVADGQLGFLNYLTAEQGVRKFLSYFSGVYGRGKSLALLSMNESGFLRITQTLEALAAAEQIHIIGMESFNRGESDFRSLLLRLKQKRPDALLLLGLSPEIEMVARQARQINFGIPLTSIESFGLAAKVGEFEGSWFVDAAVTSSEFQNRYEQRFETKVTAGVGHAYDSVRMLEDVFGSGDWHRRFREIRDFRGALGELSVRPDGVIWSDASVKRISNGRAEVVAP